MNYDLEPTNPVEYLIVVIIDEIFPPQRTLFRNQDIDSQRLTYEMGILGVGDYPPLHARRTIDQKICCAISDEIIREPSVERSKMPFVEIVIEAINGLYVLVFEAME